ncbi:tetraacyldisaccharide 4'-kinase [Shewanella sp. 10N.286.48.B5]|uniref:tetraacyldisaccharide 4'-kinase n=1 Tax=Shewanella sp. 10N.286.48.B5 TaxID=1880834 RepID=UPI000C8592F8|nr:tetraacyldisaccharide 4'-kinase [Shewanella sp. 10N.286.48.B5]PMH87072.1 tetraacyldisaccharide 4'-kinase [Shewanella sp. 10N.286.48.B5]
MQALVNKIWYQGHRAKWLLLPLSALFGLISSVRRWAFKLGFKQAQVLDVPVVIVGNITAGGSGKTPTVIYLINLLRQQGYTPGVISRGYGVNIDGVKTVKATDNAADVGDEPAMIVARTQVPMVVGAKRIDAAKQLLSETNVDVIISDDGLQHYALARDIEINIVDGQRRYGNQCLIPAGPLREGLWRLNSIDWVLNNGGVVQGNEVAMSLTPAALKPVKPNSTQHWQPQAAIAMAGIGNPQRFFDSLSLQGFSLAETKAFEDHQAFDENELKQLSKQHPLIMTEKDAVKCRDFAQDNWWYLPVNAKLNTEFDTAFLNRLNQVIKDKQGNLHGVR